jgi:hypothetical protein
MQGRSCVKATKQNLRHRRCTRYINAGAFTHQDAAGANRLRLTGRIQVRELAPGLYRLQAIPHNNAGIGPAAYASFRIEP